MNDDLPDLRAWLTRTGYRPQTIDLTIRDARQVLAWSTQGRDLPVRLRPCALRVIDYLDGVPHCDTTLAVERDAFERLAAAVPDPRARRLSGKKKRKHGARSFGDEEWVRLLAVIDTEGSVQASVLVVCTSTGLRIGDVLRIARAKLGEAQKTGRLVLEVKGGDERTLNLDGAPDAWAHLWALWAQEPGARNVAALVSGSDDTTSHGAAYQSVSRKLKALAETAGVVGRAHLHRLRRTVGVQALRVTEDVVAVQQLLGHKSHNTTLGYLDEARPDRVATLQQQIRTRFGGTK